MGVASFHLMMHTLQALKPKGGPGEPKHCPHGKGFNCVVCWPNPPHPLMTDDIEAHKRWERQQDGKQ